MRKDKGREKPKKEKPKKEKRKREEDKHAVMSRDKKKMCIRDRGTTITLAMSIEDEPGLLSDVLKIIADFGANILTIHQSIPINGVASLSISVQVLSTTGCLSYTSPVWRL